MKFTLTFKTPGVTDQAPWPTEENGEGDMVEIYDDEFTKVINILEKFIRYSEYLSVEFDTETGTATVLRAN